MDADHLDELLYRGVLHEITSSNNPYVTKETIVGRVLYRLAARANVNFPPLDLVPRPCVLDERAHNMILDMWEKRKAVLLPTLEELQCLERVLGRDRVRPSDLIRLMQYVTKNCDSNLETVHILFAVDGCRGEDLKNYVDTFFFRDDMAKALHVNQVRMMLSVNKLPDPSKVKSVLEKVWNNEMTGEDERETECMEQYRQAMGNFNVRDWRMNYEEVARKTKKRKPEEETED